MDANGQNFCLMSEAAHWTLLETPSGVEFDLARRSLRLARQRREVSFNDDPVLAQEKLQLCPQARDAYGNRAAVNPARNGIVVKGLSLTTGETEIYLADDENSEITDIVMGHDDVLYIAVDGHIIMHDRRDRWQHQNVEVPAVAGFNAWRMAADPRGGVWVLDKDNRKLGRVLGLPLHKLSKRNASATTPQHCERNTNPPILRMLPHVIWNADETPVAIACNQQSRVALLSWQTGQPTSLRLLDDEFKLTRALHLLGSSQPYSFQWLNDNQIALLLAGVNREAPVYAVDLIQLLGSESNLETGLAHFPMGDLYPLKKDFNGGPFLHGLDQPPHYPTLTASRALHRLSFPFYARQGQAVNHPMFAAMDGGEPNRTWHRVFLEAVIPAGCGIKIWLAATDDKTAYENILPEHWYEHRFGQQYQQNIRTDTPVAVWENFASEMPHHPGLLPCEIEKNKSGLFSVLIQRASRQLRPLRGRYLHVHVELSGQGHETPEIFALRAYGARFSYIDEYLPQLYQESVFPSDDTEQPDTATAADFYGRFVANFEGILTNIEDRIAQSHLLTGAQTTPASALPWLASWIGHEVNPAFSETIQRQFLQAAPELNRWHGTLRGLKLALEIATQGSVSGGEIVIVEDFRLRRTFASIIGADLVIEDDPLTAGGSVNTNAFVGDTLFIGDENEAEFLALFGAGLAVNLTEQKDIDAFFDKLAHRLTVLVHDDIHPQNLGLIKRVTREQSPAHVEAKVLSASSKFLVGLSSLVGVDSYLAHRPKPGSARVGETRLGKNDFITGQAALDNRLQGLGAGLPLSEDQIPLALATDASVELSDEVTLDGSQSRAFGGRHVTQFNWEYKPKNA
jgi:phage tail-like protein